MFTFLELFKNDETLAATSEIMMMGINRSTRRPASFPTHYKSNIQIYYDSQYDKRWPKSLGHQIGIPKERRGIMTDTISEILENTLFDLSDTLKIHLIELNENRSLFMNGPSRELIQRTFNISFTKDKNKR